MDLLLKSIRRTESRIAAIRAQHGGRWTKDALEERDILEKLNELHRQQLIQQIEESQSEQA